MLLIIFFIQQIGFSQDSALPALKNTDSLLSRIHELASGDTLVIEEGTYIFEDTLEISDLTKITIQGAGDVWIICRDVNQDVFSLTDCEDIGIQNIHMRHLEPLKEYECHGAVVSIENSKRIILYNCEMNGCGAIGVTVYSSSDIIVDNCLIHENSFSAFYLDTVEHMLIYNNIIKNNGSYIEQYETKDLAVFLNKIENNTGYWE